MRICCEPWFPKGINVAARRFKLPRYLDKIKLVPPTKESQRRTKMRTESFGFRLWLGLGAALLCMVSLPAETRAQMTRGAISGTVRDEAGASVPGALVKVTNPQPNVSRE